MCVFFPTLACQGDLEGWWEQQPQHYSGDTVDGLGGEEEWEEEKGGGVSPGWGANHEEQAGGQRFPEGRSRGNTGGKVKRPRGPVNRI